VILPQPNPNPVSAEIPEPPCVLIPSGSYLMGCETGRDEEKPVHRVYVDAFELGVYQVRNRDWVVFMEAMHHPAPKHWGDSEFSHPDQPVVAVNWFEAVKYCQWLGSLSGRRYRLPTEAEWEWAALGGREGALYPWGDDRPQDWPEYMGRWGGDVTGPLPVGLGAPNPYGLFDISENVHEWCADWFDRAYYAVSPERNPQGPPGGERRASRGGSWRHQIKASRCAARSSIPPVFEYADYGFRVARHASQSQRNDTPPERRL
jgi:sulfatase modifying factor 1